MKGQGWASRKRFTGIMKFNRIAVLIASNVSKS
jgi:hypothetical protein